MTFHRLCRRQGLRRLVVGLAAFELAVLPLAALAASEPFFLDIPRLHTSSPAIAAQPGGGFVAAWTRDVVLEQPFGPDAFVPEFVVVRELTRGGTPILDPNLTEAHGPGSPSMPQVAATDLDRAIVIWHRLLDGAFRIEGTPRGNHSLGFLTVIDGCITGRLSSLRVAPAARDGYWALWRETCGGRRVVAQRLGRMGRPVGPNVVVAGPLREPGLFVDVAGLPNGGFAAVWIEGARFVRARVFGPDGQPHGAAFHVANEPVADPPGSLPPATVAIGAAGDRLLVAWRSRDSHVLVRAFETTGVPLGSPRRAGLAADGAEEMPRLACCARNQAVLSWRRVGGVTGESSCFLRRIGLDARPRGSEALLAESCTEAAIALDEEGRLMALWSEPFHAGDDHSHRVKAQRFSLSDLK